MRIGAVSKVCLVLAVLILSAICASAADPLGEAAAKSGKPLIVDFGLNLCKQCIRQSEAMDRLKESHGGKIGLTFVHVTKEAGTAADYKIMLIPTLLFFDSRGKEVFRQVGYMAYEDILTKIDELGLLKK